MAEYLQAYNKLLGNEGGYANDPKDTGGETYAGISRKYNPTWSGWPLVDSHKPLKHGEVIKDPDLEFKVKNFYKANYWDKCKCDNMNSQRVAEFIFDWYVNSGTNASKALQNIIGVGADGIVGQVTINKVNEQDEELLMGKLIAARKQFYHAIVAKEPSQEKWLKGWLDRVDRFA